MTRSANRTGPAAIFDGHNDVLLRLWSRRSGDATSPNEEEIEQEVSHFLAGTKDGHLDLPRARQGGMIGGLFAVFVPSPDTPGGQDFTRALPSQLDPAQPVDQTTALAAATAMAAILARISRASAGSVRQCTTVAQIRAAIAAGAMATVLHIEGAEPIDTRLDALWLFHQAGLRSLGPVWSRANAFGHGVPFRHHSSPDTGPGLTDAGKALIRALNELRILIDLSHINENGFWDVHRLSTAPLVATHSNVHALCPHARNLTDRQLDAIRASDGVVGVNFATGFLREDGQRLPNTPLTEIVRHVNGLVERMGIRHVALGSDFDGALIPSGIGDAAGLGALVTALRDAGYDDEALACITHENWFRVLEQTWGG